MSKQLPDFYSLSPAQVGEVIDDLRLIQEDNARIYYAIDPFELQDFCFPIDPTKPARKVDIQTIADDQAALFEVFYKQRPLLFSEYLNEMEQMLTYFRNTTDKLRDKSEMIDRLIKDGRLDFPDEDSVAQDTFLRENFNIILAIAMGIFSLGVDRLDNIYQRLTKGDFTDETSPREMDVIGRIVRDYKPTEHHEIILKQLGRPMRGPSKNTEEGRVNSDKTDATAIDRVIYLNTAFGKAYEDGELTKRYLILYLSTALKTVRLFTSESVSRFLPTINGRPYNFWRTRAQLFVYVVHKDKDGNHSESIKNLERVRSVLDEIIKFEGLFPSVDCNVCPLKTDAPAAATSHQVPCRWKDFCEKVKDLDDEIQKARTEVHNFGLINTLSEYDSFRRAKPQGESQKQYLDFFKTTFESSLREKALTEMMRLERWILVKSEFTNIFTQALGIGKRGLDQSALRTGKDFVRGLDQYLPTKPKLKASKYQEILDSILQFYRDPTVVEPIEDAYKNYIELDADTRGVDLEHELIRCFLYLALPRTQEGDEKAYNHAEAITHSDKLLNTEEWGKASEAIKQEYRYVQCWAARRTGRFERAIELAKEGIELDRDDPRFFHGLCLSIYSWLTKRAEEGTPKIEEAIDAAQTAINLYLKAAKSHENDEVVAANYNNLAYFLALSVEMAPQESPAERETDEQWKQRTLDRARDALDHLKKFIDKDNWESTKHPEFFHTEAYLEYQESTVANLAGDRVKALSKLKNAKREIDKAIKLFEEGPGHEGYRALKDKIERELEILSRM